MIAGFPDLPTGDIPDFKGLVSGGTDALISFGGAAIIRAIFGDVWGVFNQYGIPILLADTFESVTFNSSGQVAQAPIEKGSFASYNKVQNPYKASVVLTKGVGGATERGAFIAQLEVLQKSSLLFHIVTPDYVHTNASIIGFDYARKPQDGARIIVAQLHLEEVREVKVRYEETQQPAEPEDAETVDNGEQQPDEQEGEKSLLVRIKESEIVQKSMETVGELMDTVNELYDQGVEAVSELFAETQAAEGGEIVEGVTP